MRVYFLKSDLTCYQISPVPQNIGDYYMLHIDSLDILASHEVVVVRDGSAKLVSKRPSACHKWDGRRWVHDDELFQCCLDELRHKKLVDINKAAQEYVDSIAKTYETPEFERDTWLTQRSEAMAWKQDPSTPTPTLDRIAMNRGVDPTLLKEKAYQKSMLFTMLSDTIAGQRQKLEDLLMASKSVEEIEQINIQFNFSPEVTHA